MTGDLVDALPGPIAHPLIEPGQRGWKKPGLCNRSVSAVVGLVHMSQGAEKLLFAGELSSAQLGRFAAKLCARTGDEQRAIALYLDHVAIPGDRPERPPAW